MRDVLCYLMTMIFLCSCVFAASVPEALPPVRQSAWWSLLLPGFFAQPTDGDAVIFTWPILRQMVVFFRRNG